MLNLKLAKSMMENEEGLNHLWIKVEPIEGLATHVRLDLYLPAGVFREGNYNGFFENDVGSIFLEDGLESQNIFIEIFTQEAISCGKEMLTARLSYRDQERNAKEFSKSIPLFIADEAEMENVVIDEEVVALFKDLHPNLIAIHGQDSEFVVYRSKVISLPAQVSELEKKYRITY